DVLDDGCSPPNYSPAFVESGTLGVIDLRQRLCVGLLECRDVGGISRIDGALNRGPLRRGGGLRYCRRRETEQEYRKGEGTYHAEPPDEVWVYLRNVGGKVRPVSASGVQLV